MSASPKKYKAHLVLMGKKREVHRLVGVIPELRHVCLGEDPITLERAADDDLMALFRTGLVKKKSRRKSESNARSLQHVYGCYSVASLAQAFEHRAGGPYVLPDNRAVVSWADKEMLLLGARAPTEEPAPPSPPPYSPTDRLPSPTRGRARRRNLTQADLRSLREAFGR